MSERRTRKDKGLKRKPAETPREGFLDYFAGLSYEDRARLVADLQIIQRYAPEVKYVDPLKLIVTDRQTRAFETTIAYEGER